MNDFIAGMLGGIGAMLIAQSIVYILYSEFKLKKGK